MTKNLFRKALGGTLLAATMLVTSLFGSAKANPTEQTLNGLSGDDSPSEQETNLSDIEPDAVSIDADGTIPVMSAEPIMPSAQVPGAIVSESAVPESVTVEPIAIEPPSVDTVSSLSAVSPLNAANTAVTEPSVLVPAHPVVAQQAVAQESIAQENNIPVDDSFAPLSDDEIRELLLIDPAADIDAPRPAPGSSFLTPSAYGADWGDAYVGVAGVTAGNQSDLDGSASVGFGLGDAVDSIGVEISVGVISLDGFADDGIVGFKIHKVFPELNNLGVAVGWSNPIKWGDANDSPDTYYGVVTQQFELDPGEPHPVPVTVSLGVGTGAYRSRGAIAADNNDPNIFGSIGVRVIPELSVISSWNGSGVGVAASTAPFDIPLVITAGFSDVTDQTAAGTRFNASVGYSFSF